MFTNKPYYTTETAVRVREDHWFDCEENRQQIQKIAWCFAGDDNYPRAKPLTILVMDRDGLGCVGFIDPDTPIKAIPVTPTLEDEREAEKATHEASKQYEADIIANRDCRESKAALLCAIETENSIRFRRQRAALSEVICSI